MEREVCSSIINNGCSGLGCSSLGLAVESPMRGVLENDEDGNKEKKITGSEAAAGGGCGSGSIHSSGNTVKCPVCSKSFQSEKAMHGHMRCHPERGWKGIIPPPPSSSSTSHEIEISLGHSIVVSSNHIAPPPPPAGWLKTGRRGQNRIIDHTTSSSPNPNISTPSLGQMIYCASKKLKMDIGRGALEDTANKGGGDGVSWKEYPEIGSTLSVRPRKYKCKTCNKIFPTLQALTGNGSPTMGNEQYEHWSSPTAAPPEEDQEGIALLASASSRHAKQQQVRVPKAHKCKLCSKAFTTGQALGGHQTTHRNRSAVESDSAPQQEPEPEPVLFLEEAARQSAGPEVALGFDLNKLPPMEEEAEEEQM